jgi:2-keto-3-deoxy-L-fuconate dehydrogenase
MRFKSSVALVTGGASGIGLATAKALAVEGAAIAVVDLDARLGRAAVASLRELGVQAELFTTDVADPAAVDAAVTAAAGHFGRLDVLINSAGIVGRGGFEQTGVEEWRKILEIDLSSVFYTTRAVLPVFKQVGGGSIVNISSVAGAVTGPPNRFTYSATKAAVAGLTKSVAADFIKQGVRCNAICPGTVESPSLEDRMRAQGDYETARKAFLDRQPMGRLGKPEEIAALATYLASDEAGFTTGQLHVIDGGWTT